MTLEKIYSIKLVETYTSIIFLEKDLIHTPKDENQIWLVPHPFFFKNTPDIYWTDIGDSP